MIKTLTVASTGETYVSIQDLIEQLADGRVNAVKSGTDVGYMIDTIVGNLKKLLDAPRVTPTNVN